jgi:hypothetical protein
MTATTRSHAPIESLEDRTGTLRCVVGHIIPPSATYGVPGADDPQIFADILRSGGRDLPDLERALLVIDEMAGGQLTSLSHERQAQVLAAFHANEPELAHVVEAVTARCYYRDDRIMASIGVEARPPFPVGYEVEQGDWSLLDPVRRRGKIYRDIG